MSSASQQLHQSIRLKWVSVSTAAQLQAAIANHTTITLAGDIFLNITIEIHGKTAVLINGMGFKLDANRSVRCFHIDGGSNVEMRDLIVMNGYPGYGQDGGGIFLESSTLTMNSCVVSNDFRRQRVRLHGGFCAKFASKPRTNLCGEFVQNVCRIRQRSAQRRRE